MLRALLDMAFKIIAVAGLILNTAAPSANADSYGLTGADKYRSDGSNWLTGMTPDRATLMLGGYRGNASLGAMYLVNHFYATEFSLGYTSRAAGGRPIKQFNWLNKVNLFSSYHGMRRSWDGYLNIGMLYSPDKELFLTLPAHYPRYYYTPTAVRFLAGVGFEARIQSAYDAFVEYNFHDSELYGYEKSPYAGALQNLGALGMGIRWRLP